ncbi:MAG TPA: hypothetical protein VMT56_02225 [Candidatus Bathyarchaeia archaeon]|nr:hypothetical protein [Candidatus Bathyarchaeia archaeon]
MSIDTGALAQQMLAAALPVLKTHAIDAESFASVEFKKIADTVASIEVMLHAGQINDQQAQLLFDMQKSASRSVLLTVKGLSLLAAEEAINAALAVVRTVVNAAVKFPLIP